MNAYTRPVYSLLAIVLMLMSIGAASVPSLAQVRYAVTDLDTLGGSTSQAYAINNRSEVVGRAALAGDSESRAFRWSNGHMIDLGTLVGPGSIACGINDNGQIVGSANSSSNPNTPTNHAFLWQGNPMKDLGTVGAATGSMAFSINKTGTIVGAVTVPLLFIHAFVYVGGVMTDVGIPFGLGTTTAYSVNDLGQVVGTLPSAPNAFLWQNGKFTTLTSLPGGFNTNARSINNAGQIAGGSSVANGEYHAAVWQVDASGNVLSTTDLGTVGGGSAFSFGINSAGTVVGSVANINGTNTEHAFVSVGSKVVDLNTLIPGDSGWELVEARAINDKGEIVGYGTHNSQTRAFLLTPQTIQPSRAVLLVHGIFSSADKWNENINPYLSMRARLQAEGYFVEATDFPTEPETLSNEAPIVAQARALRRRIQELRRSSGERSVDLVCHSMGGLAARWYLHHPDLWPIEDGVPYSGVSKLIMIGTPNWGTDIELLNPIVGVIAARWSDPGHNSDFHTNWSPALNDMFAEWEPAPLKVSAGLYGYPDGFKLGIWPIVGGWRSPIHSHSYNVADAALVLLKGGDRQAVRAAVKAFPEDLRQRARNHLSYYPEMAATLGVMYHPTSDSTVWGVNARRISPILLELNVNTVDTSGAKMYIIAGTENRVVMPDLPDFRPGPYNRFVDGQTLDSDGLVPLLSVLGVDPLTGSTLFPDAKTQTFFGVFTNHTDLPKNGLVIDQVVQWLKE